MRSEEENCIPYDLLLRGWGKLNLKEKLIWKSCEIWQKFKQFLERLQEDKQ